MLLNIDQYFVRPVLFFEHIINMQDKIQMQEPDTAHTSQLSSLDTLLMMNIGTQEILTWGECFVARDVWVHVSEAGEASTQATASIQSPVTSRGDICNEESEVSEFLFSKQDPRLEWAK